MRFFKSEPHVGDEKSPLLVANAGYSTTSTLDCQSECSNGSVSPAAKTDLPILKDSIDGNVVFHIHSYQMASQHRMQLVYYMGLLLTYFGVTLTLFIANNFDQDYIESTYFLAFHHLEFWGALIFSIAEALVFYMNTDYVLGGNLQTESSASISASASLSNQVALGLVSFNVIATAVATFLFCMSPETFEEPAHFIEYSAQITITSVDYIFILQGQGRMSPSTDDESNTMCWSTGRTGQLLLATLLLIMAIAKLFLYAGCIPTGSVGNERSSHYVEFLGEMMNSLWAYSFTLQQYHSVGRKLQHHHSRLKGGNSRQSLLAQWAREQTEEGLV